MSEKDYIVQVKVKNGPMLRAIRGAGFSGALALSRVCGVNQGRIGDYLNLKLTPIKTDGTFRESVIKISETLKCMPEDLFPPQHLEKALKKNWVEIEASSADVLAIMDWGVAGLVSRSSEDELISEETANRVTAAISSLTEREQKVIRSRFGFDGPEKTLEEIGNENRVGRECVRQILDKAMRRLQEPSKELPRVNEWHN